MEKNLKIKRDIYQKNPTKHGNHNWGSQIFIISVEVFPSKFQLFIPILSLFCWCQQNHKTWNGHLTGKERKHREEEMLGTLIILHPPSMLTNFQVHSMNLCLYSPLPISDHLLMYRHLLHSSPYFHFLHSTPNFLTYFHHLHSHPSISSSSILKLWLCIVLVFLSEFTFWFGILGGFGFLPIQLF